jgi:hypothetical protein
MKRKNNSPVINQNTSEADELDELNARNRKAGVQRFMEATIETKAKKRRSQEVLASAAWKPT